MEALVWEDMDVENLKKAGVPEVTRRVAYRPRDHSATLLVDHLPVGSSIIEDAVRPEAGVEGRGHFLGY